VTETIKDNIDRALNGELAVSTIMEDTYSQSANKTSRDNSTNDLKVEQISSEFKINTNDSISHDNLRNSLRKQPSSSNNQPLEKVVLSETYFTHFLLISSIMIFFIGLFN